MSTGHYITMKWFLILSLLSLLGTCYSYLLCDTSNDFRNSTLENERQNWNSSCIRLHSNNRQARAQPNPGGSNGPQNPGGSNGPQNPGGSRGPQIPGGSRGPPNPGGSQAPPNPGGSRGPQNPGGSQAPPNPGGSRGPQNPGGSQAPPNPGGSRGPQNPGGSQGPPNPGGSQGPPNPGGSQGPPRPGGPNGPPNRGQRPNNLIDPSQNPLKTIKELVDGPGRFRVKHMYMDGRYGKDINSFAELSGNPEKIREYIVDVNRRLYKDRILPVTTSNTDNFDKWIRQTRNNPKKISLVDADLTDIQADIFSQQAFQDYLTHVRANPQDVRRGNMFTTNDKYPVTDMHLSMNGDDLQVHLERFEGVKLRIGMHNEEVYHYDPFERLETQQVLNPQTMSTATVVEVQSTSLRAETTFTRAQLQANERITLAFWNELFDNPVNQVGFKGPINDQGKRYSRLKVKYEKEWRDDVVKTPTNPVNQIVGSIPGACARGGAGRKKRAGSKCAIYFDSEGEVESIHPEEFLEIYEGTGEEGRRRMTEMVKNNGDKFTEVDEAKGLEARRKLNQLVHHDEMTVHGELVETTGNIQDWRRWKTPVPNKPSQIVTAIQEAVSTRVHKVRLSASKIVNTLAKNPHINEVAKAGKTFGSIMMTKGLITGIIHNDTTALAVVGSRIGYDMLTGVAVDVGTKFFTAASKIGKAAKFLSKVAGPIGAAIDVGLGIWSLVKSVDRLKHAENKFDRDDAIADIVSESIDMTVAITTTALSLAFPPAAPVIIVVGLVLSILNGIATSLFKAGNEVGRIDAQIPLLGFEKEYVFTSRLFDIFGLREKNYIDYLVEEKKANDMAVDMYLDFLKKNTQFLGVVFPSRTLHYDGGCYLKMYDCSWGTWLGRAPCDKQTILGKGCDFNGPCAEDGRSCMNETTDFKFYDCICDSEAKTDFGFPHDDQYVDFRKKQTVYWDRAVPGDVSGAQFKCKPSSLKFSDLKKQKKNSVHDYFCEKAIGLYRPRKERKPGQSFLIDLQEGTDHFIIDRDSDTTSYTFFMGEKGNKQFRGGKSKNDFILNGNCSIGELSGLLYGGPKDTDSLIIAPSCAKGKAIRIDNTYNERGSLVRLENKLKLKLQEVETIIGRPNEAEIVDVSCNTRRVILNGGASSKSPDSIAIEPLRCPIDVLAVLSNYTDISSRAGKGDVTIYVEEDMSGSTVHVKRLRPGRYSPPRTTIIFTQTRSQDILFDGITIKSDDVTLKLKSHPQREALTIRYSSEDKSSSSPSQHQLFFNESTAGSPNSFSILMVPGTETSAKNSPLTFYHNLQSHRAKEIRRDGSDIISNLFNVSAPNWDVRGDGKDDTFILNVPFNQVRLYGGGGDNTLVLATTQHSVVDLNNLYRLSGVQTVVKGENSGHIEISTSCETKAVVIKGESEPDIVNVNSCSTKRELQIDAGGSTRVLIQGDIVGDKEAVRILAHPDGQQRISFELDTLGNKVSRLLVQITLGRKNTQEIFAQDILRSKDGNSFQVKLNGGEVNKLNFNLRVKDNDDSPYISSPQIQLIRPNKNSWSGTLNPVQLVFQRETLQPVAVHIVQDTGKDYGLYDGIYGFERLENLFQIYGEKYLYNVYGGKLKDTFIGTSTALSLGMIAGDSESDNTLIVKDDPHKSPESEAVFQVDLHERWMGLLLKGSEKRAHVDGGFHHVIGRTNQPDTIVPSCGVKSIAGRGGSGKDHPDIIEIEQERNGNCGANNLTALEMHLGPFTKVQNLAVEGVFKYLVDLTQAAEFLSFSFIPNENTDHKIVFTLPSLGKGGHVEVETVKFDKSKKSLVFTVKDHSSSAAVYEFPMYKKDEKSDYSNPRILLTTSGDQWVTSDLRVNNQGNAIATSLLDGYCSTESDWSKMIVKGLPLEINNFLVNITGDGKGDCGKVQGYAGAIENHIWLYGLPANKDFKVEGAQFSAEQVMNGVTNTLHIDDNFHGNKPVTVYLSPEKGYVKRHGDNGTVALKWIDSLEGRSHPSSYDTVVPSCYTKQVSGVDLVSILLDPSADCIYSLIIGVNPITKVKFSWVENTTEQPRGNLTKFWNSTFHYRFSEPMSFEVAQSYLGMLDGTVHNFYLSFDLADLETLEFDEDESKLRYTVDSEEYAITMITHPHDEDQFYLQPNMVTRDGFRFQIARDASVTITGVLKGIQPLPIDLLSIFQGVANTLGVTMVMQTDTAFFHIGNDGTVSGRNALQNVAFARSYLGGGGAADTIYEVVSLNKDVFIATDLENGTLVPAVNTEGPYIAKQTIDLTDIVAPIRYKSGEKYKPKVTQVGDDLIVRMEGHQSEYPGEVVILNGAIEKVRTNLQILLSNAMMELVPSNNLPNSVSSWELSPIDVHLERETVYSIAAEDLEDGHHVIVLDHKYGPEYRFRFNYSRNGDDLQLSDIEEFKDHKYDRQHIEMTTVIITDFYKNSSSSNSSLLPAEIRNVTLFLPGLKIKLDGTDVLLLSNESEITDTPEVYYIAQNQSSPAPPPAPTISSTTATIATPVLLTIGMVPKWSDVLHQVEDDILTDLPYVHRMY